MSRFQLFRHVGPGPSLKAGPFCQAIGEKRCVTATFKGKQINFAPHIVYMLEGVPTVAGADADKHNKKKLDTYAVAELSNVEVLDRTFEPQPGFDPGSSEYGGEVFCVVEVV